MSSRGRFVIAVTAVALLCGTTAFAQGWGGPGGHHGGGGGFGWRILRVVGLSDAQKTQIRQVYANHRPTLQTLHQQLGAAQQGLGDKLYSATPPTAADVAAVSQLRSQLAQERFAIQLEVRNVLTPDQLAKAAQIRQQLQQLRQQQRNLLTPSP